MNKLQPIFTEMAACQDCYKCVRECPVKAISVRGGRASVLGELCVLCGHCVEVCPVGAKKVRSDVERAKVLLKTRERVSLSLAPSFAAEFPDVEPERLVGALKALGFHSVSETAIGADLVSEAAVGELELLAAAPQGRPRVLISTACPVIVDYIERYRPELTALLSPSASPMRFHARFLREEGGVSVVFAGPCIAKKREADRERSGIEAAITFKGLKSWLKDEGIDPYTAAADGEGFFPGRAGKGAFYPVDGGMCSQVRARSRGLACEYLSFSGFSAAEKALEGLSEYRGSRPVFLELMACEGGCVNGPRADVGRGSVAKRLGVLGYAGPEGRGDFERPRMTVPRAAVQALASQTAGEEELRAALARIGKRGPEDELNCSGCGYDTCRAFAEAFLAGKAERTMCVSYMRDLAQKKATALISAMPSGVVVADSALELLECNERFARLLGPEALAAWEAKPGLQGAELSRLFPQSEAFARVLSEGGPRLIERDFKVGDRVLHGTIFEIERGLYVGGIFQDITTPWIERDRVVAQAKTVIDKNLRTVQRIAYLLGENAAETEGILDSIIETFSAPGPEK